MMGSVLYSEATQSLSDDPMVKFWAHVRIAHRRAGCNCDSCRGHWVGLRRWLRAKVRGIARVQRSRDVAAKA